MGLTTAGVVAIVDLLTGVAFTAYDNNNAHLGVGDDDTAFAEGQTDLQAATNKFRQPMDSGFPTQPTSETIKFQATFATGNANFTWKEWGVFNGVSAGTMLVREEESPTPWLGTKDSSEAWQFTVTLTVANS